MNSTCIQCDATLAADAAFCPSCGRAVAGAGTAPAFDPEVRRAVANATQRARGIVSVLGVTNTAAAAGGLFAVLGAFLPYISASVPSVPQMATYTGNMSLIHFGVAGTLVLLGAIALGGIPLILPLSRWHAIAGVGVCAIVLSKLIGDWIMFGMIQNLVSTASAAATAINPGVGNPGLAGAGFGAGAGLYCLVLGFALLFYSYARRAN